MTLDVKTRILSFRETADSYPNEGGLWQPFHCARVTWANYHVTFIKPL